MSSLRVLLVCCAVGVWLNACGAPADPEVAVAQLVFATYGAGDGVTVAYLAPVPTEQPAFAVLPSSASGAAPAAVWPNSHWHPRVGQALHSPATRSGL